MNKNSVVFVILGVFAGLIGGFVLANGLNRSELNQLRNQISQAKSAPVDESKNDQSLSSEEIRAKIDEADRNPENLAFQKNLGVGLYRYAAMKQDTALLSEAQRILTRANSLDPKDYEVLVALGNSHFDIGFNKKDQLSFQTARGVYSKALEQKPDDADVRTDLGLTYFLQEPPDYDKAIAELQKARQSNPKHERSLQFLVQTYVKQNKFAEADKALAQLKALNSANPAIADLTTQIAAAQSGTGK